MGERKNLVTLKGEPIVLVGHAVKVGDRAPDVELVDNDMNPVSLSGYFGKILVLSSVSSLDTPVCDVQTRRFNEEASKLGNDVQIITVSMDLPFAQKRWCGMAGVDRVTTLSDYRSGDFGDLYGVFIKDVHLLARAIFVLDRKATVRYIQIVPEIGQEPDYDPVLREVKALVEETPAVGAPG